jgi:hypothetical protein
MDPGHLIAIQLILLYTILGPLVLLAIYVLFDSFSKRRDTGTIPQDKEKTDPALWVDDDVDEHLGRN